MYLFVYEHLYSTREGRLLLGISLTWPVDVVGEGPWLVKVRLVMP